MKARGAMEMSVMCSGGGFTLTHRGSWWWPVPASLPLPPLPFRQVFKKFTENVHYRKMMHGFKMLLYQNKLIC